MDVGNKGHRIIVANWKMNMTRQQSEAFMRDFADRLVSWPEWEAFASGRVQVVICPPYTALDVVRLHIPATGVFLGAQNVHWCDRGPYTGEISPVMLSELGCSHVLVGHSERRRHAGEDDHQVALRLETALRHGLQPILCVGENEQERQAGQAEAVVRRQVAQVLDGVREELLGRELAIAYEPVWAIGSGKAATSEDALHMSSVIRQVWDEVMQGHAHCRLLYGGSVNAGNIGGFLQAGTMDGALVGGDSLKASSFFDLIRMAVAW